MFARAVNISCECRHIISVNNNFVWNVKCARTSIDRCEQQSKLGHRTVRRASITTTAADDHLPRVNEMILPLLINTLRVTRDPNRSAVSGNVLRVQAKMYGTLVDCFSLSSLSLGPSLSHSWAIQIALGKCARSLRRFHWTKWIKNKIGFEWNEIKYK